MDTAVSTISPGTYRQVLGAYPTGVSVVTGIDPEHGPLALVVGSFTSVSLDPPLVGFFPDKQSSTWPHIARTGHFCINVLGSDQLSLCMQLARSGLEKFSRIPYNVSIHGMPVIDSPLACIDCAIEDIVEAGDHYFVTGRTLHMEILRDGDPLIFHRGAFGGFKDIA